jgi:hypothetical protein
MMHMYRARTDRFLQERTERIVVILTEVVLEEMCPAFDKLVGELIDVCRDDVGAWRLLAEGQGSGLAVAF